MPLIKNRYGKGRVRVMRIHRDGERHEVSQLSVKAMIEGDFARAYTHADNSTSVATDTIKNIVNVVARENTGLCTEEFCQVLAQRYLDTYPQIASVAIISARDQMEPPEFRRQAASPQLCARQQRQAVRRSRCRARGAGGIDVRHRRLCLHEVDAVRLGELSEGPLHHAAGDRRPDVRHQHGGILEVVGEAASYPAANARILDTLLEVFGTTYSMSVQDSLYRMGEAALAAVPEISEISMACPNMHFIPMNLSAFGLDNNNDVFLPTDEPHGQIECTVGRG